ncbi:hypothetical protein BpHYR1_004448, partial [Brachionus plicatilis]
YNVPKIIGKKTLDKLFCIFLNEHLLNRIKRTSFITKFFGSRLVCSVNYGSSITGTIFVLRFYEPLVYSGRGTESMSKICYVFHN